MVFDDVEDVRRCLVLDVSQKQIHAMEYCVKCLICLTTP